MLDAQGRLMPNSVRSTPSATRLAAGEGPIHPVRICIDPDPNEAKVALLRSALRMAHKNLESSTYTIECQNLIKAALGY